MNRRLFNILMAGAVAGLSLSCNQEDIAPEIPDIPDTPDTPAVGYHFTFDGGVGSETGTRAHWTDNKGNGNLIFNWDYTTQEAIEDGEYEMVMRFKKEESTLVSNYMSKYTFASIHKHSGHPDDAHWAEFQTVETYPNDMSSGEYDGYNVLAVTPICDANIDYTYIPIPDEEFEATLTMPGIFRQNADQDPGFLRDYMYMYATSTIKNGGASLDFRHIPATLRFIITNKRPTEATFKSVQVSLADATQPVASVSVTIDNEGKLTFSQDSYTTITTQLGENGTTVQKNAKYTVYALALPLADDKAFEGTQLKFTIEAGDPDNRYLSFVLYGDQIEDANRIIAGPGVYNWAGGKSYSIRMSLSDVLTFDGITAESWATPTEDYEENLKTE